MVVPVETELTFRAGAAAVLFPQQYYVSGLLRTYDLDPDGQRFLMINPSAAGRNPLD